MIGSAYRLWAGTVAALQSARPQLSGGLGTAPASTIRFAADLKESKSEIIFLVLWISKDFPNVLFAKIHDMEYVVSAWSSQGTHIEIKPELLVEAMQKAVRNNVRNTTMDIALYLGGALAIFAAIASGGAVFRLVAFWPLAPMIVAVVALAASCGIGWILGGLRWRYGPERFLGTFSSNSGLT